MRTILYDPSRAALYHPEAGVTVLKPGAHPSDELLCGEAARLVYKRFESNATAAREIHIALGNAGFEQIKFFHNEGGTHAFAAANATTATAIVAFRGTTRAFTDILTDLKTWPTNWHAGGKVHAGFCDAFEHLRSVMESWLARHPGRWLFTGHSLGGALAALAASVFRPARLITFGAPRVGDREFSATVDGVPWRRYADCCDLVTRVPPELLGFCHGGELRYIDRNGIIHTNPSADLTKEDTRLARTEYLRECALRPGAVKLRDLADHAPINYIYPVLALDDLQAASKIPSPSDPVLR